MGYLRVIGILQFILLLIRNSTQRKHFFRWLCSLRKDYLLRKKKPWLVFDAIDFLDSLRLKGAKIFEYGSGGSTVFWLDNGADCVSIEHDQYWYDYLCDRFEEMSRIDYRLVLPEQSEDEEARGISDPSLYLSGDYTFRNYSFRRYVSQIDSFPEDFFDAILIDGRARPSCIKHAINKVKIGGIIVLDNSDREYYLRATSGLLRNFDRKIFRGVTPRLTWFTETSIFIRKK